MWFMGRFGTRPAGERARRHRSQELNHGEKGLQGTKKGPACRVVIDSAFHLFTRPTPPGGLMKVVTSNGLVQLLTGPLLEGTRLARRARQILKNSNWHFAA